MIESKKRIKKIYHIILILCLIVTIHSSQATDLTFHGIYHFFNQPQESIISQKSESSYVNYDAAITDLTIVLNEIFLRTTNRNINELKKLNHLKIFLLIFWLAIIFTKKCRHILKIYDMGSVPIAEEMVLSYIHKQDGKK